MSIRDRANKVAKDITAESKIGGYQGLPAGDYEVIIEQVTFNEKFGNLSVKASVLSGEEQGRNEFLNLSLDEVKQDGTPLPDFLIDKNIQTIAKLAVITGVEIRDDSWDNMGDMVEDFQEAVSKQLVLSITYTTAKSGKEYPNYDFAKSEAPVDPFAGKGNTIEVNDEDLPF